MPRQGSSFSAKAIILSLTDTRLPFLDAEASAAANDDRYLSGTHFNDIYTLFLFDRELREITFHYLTKVETLLKTTCAYRFSEAHQSRNAYLDVRNYATEDEYIVDEGNYQDDLQRLLSMLRAKAPDLGLFRGLPIIGRPLVF